MTRLTRLRWVGVGVALVAFTPAACATPPAAAPASGASATASPSVGSSASASPSGSTSVSPSAATSATCTDPTQSYPPAGSSSYVDQVRKRGFLLVGVSADTKLLGSVVPDDPSTFEGFDIDVARRIAREVFGKDDSTVLKFKVISAAQRIPQLTKDVDPEAVSDGGVDLVARAFTITCARWQQVAFSAEYFHATQKLLVPKTSTVTGPAQLPKGSKVCAPKGSTSIEALTAFPNVVKVGVDQHTDCLALFQQNQVDAITGDDAILAGFQRQDLYASKVLPTVFGDPQPYGLGINAKNKDFVAYVNGVLEKMRTDGSWQQAYTKWLKPALLVDATQPTPRYGRA